MTPAAERATAKTGFPPLALPLAVAVLLAAYPLHPQVRAVPALWASFAVAAVGVLAWTLWLKTRTRSRGERLSLDFRAVRPHWIQLLAQGTVLAWWGWFVRPVYEFAPFIVAQLLLAVAVEGLLNWTRRGRHTLGFGPVPVVFSVNLFLWFHLQWFFLQLAMVALVYVGKEFVRRTVDGRSRHVFNPSAFALAAASLALIATGSTDITQGVEIAQSQYVPPYIFLVIFLAALPGQLLFGVAAMTMPAVLVIWGFSAVHAGLTGEYFFHDAHVPIAVFLGLHLLFTDPATSPRSELGRVVFGVLYGGGVVASAHLLGAVGAPPFYDKLLPVPILNALAPSLDRLAGALAPRIGMAWAAAFGPVPVRRRIATAGLWAGAFTALMLTDTLGDDHPGQHYPFWAEACERGSVRACDYTGIVLQGRCDRGSGWACNEFGMLMVERDADYAGAAGEFERACRLGLGRGCANLEAMAAGELGGFGSDPPEISELPILIRGSKGPVRERDADALRALACERGWRDFC